MTNSTVLYPEWFTADELYLFGEGRYFRAYQKLGAHLAQVDGQEGVHFAVWAPNAHYVAVIGSFNGWKVGSSPLHAVGASGIWAGFIPNIQSGAVYKYHIQSRHSGYKVDKADPYAFYAEVPSKTASVVHSLENDWNDQKWMATRKERNSLRAPHSVYEVHLGSWRRTADGFRPLSYRELAVELVQYLVEMNFTHVEFMPIMEHPYDGSWGYQSTGYFAPTSRYGTPQDFMYLVDCLHQNGIGVILDWVPSHFPTDEHGLGYFDGTHLYEHQDPRKGFHPDWKSSIFNYGRNEVRAFLISSALFWFDYYHIDGIRVDAVASMLYLDYSRQDGQWIPNQYGGNENLEAIAFLRDLNQAIYEGYPDIQMTAEESTAWAMVSRPTYIGGLGFGMKWDMGWMHDTLQYFSKDPIYRLYHHNKLTFRGLYAYNENFVLPLSHDEVVHGKGSLINKMTGDEWQQFANLRLLFMYMWALPAKKLLFMGGEIAQRPEWNHRASLEWFVTDVSLFHKGVQALVRDLNRFYKEEPAMHELDFDPEGFNWVDANDASNSALSFLRSGESNGDYILCVFNFTPIPRLGYRVGVPRSGIWAEVLNSDADLYKGSGMGNLGSKVAESIPHNGYAHSLNLTLPPLSGVFFKNVPS